MSAQSELQQILTFAQQVCHEAGRLTTGYFRRSLEVIHKADDSPVTIADREAELFIRSAIEKKFPSHDIMGEEHGSKESGSTWKWYIDPIDGTKAFIHGIPFYTMLLGVTRENNNVVGIIEAPAVGDQIAAADGLGCRMNGIPIRVSQVSDLAQAMVLTTDFQHMAKTWPDERWKPLFDNCKFARTWGDGYGYYLVASGRAEIMVDSAVYPYDVAPMPVILREAGGAFFDWNGEERIDTGHGAASNAALAPLVKRTLRR
ncbi:MAG: inositol monophosphatase family protein [Candidatus Sumerlaeota bacterium]